MAAVDAADIKFLGSVNDMFVSPIPLPPSPFLPLPHPTPFLAIIALPTNQLTQPPSGNDAEVGAFNKALTTATGDAKTAIQNGKIKNKVLKLEATVLELQIKAAQGEDTAAKLATESKKLANNIALDKKAAGQASTKLAFDATTT